MGNKNDDSTDSNNRSAMNVSQKKEQSEESSFIGSSQSSQKRKFSSEEGPCYEEVTPTTDYTEVPGQRAKRQKVSKDSSQNEGNNNGNADTADCTTARPTENVIRAAQSEGDQIGAAKILATSFVVILTLMVCYSVFALLAFGKLFGKQTSTRTLVTAK